MVEQGWIQILSERNPTSHICNEKETVEIFGRIRAKHIKLFVELAIKLENI